MDLKPFSQLVGKTPLIQVSDGIYGKLEAYNPTGSVKDRLIHYLVNKSILSGEIDSETVLCEATSGNTGISLSAVAASLGLKCKIFMPSNMSRERKSMMQSFGAEVVYSQPSDFSEAIKMRNDFLDKNKSWSPMQFSNPINIECHKNTTAPEIYEDVLRLGHTWSAFIHGAGTGGTIEGVRQYLHAKKINTKVCMVRPLEIVHGIQGIGDGADYLANPDDMDSAIIISTDDAISRAKKFANDTGISVGISSGANILASEIWKSKNSDSGIIVTMLCDRGERYMSVYGKGL